MHYILHTTKLIVSDNIYVTFLGVHLTKMKIKKRAKLAEMVQ